MRNDHLSKRTHFPRPPCSTVARDGLQWCCQQLVFWSALPPSAHLLWGLISANRTKDKTSCSRRGHCHCVTLFDLNTALGGTVSKHVVVSFETKARSCIFAQHNTTVTQYSNIHSGWNKKDSFVKTNRLENRNRFSRVEACKMGWFLQICQLCDRRARG